MGLGVAIIKMFYILWSNQEITAEESKLRKFWWLFIQPSLVLLQIVEQTLILFSILKKKKLYCILQ